MINEDEYFRKVVPFRELQACMYEGCDFRAHTLQRLNIHLREHTLRAALQTSVARVSDLSHEMGVRLAVSQRRDMGEQSLRRKQEERDQGLSPPPLVLDLGVEEVQTDDQRRARGRARSQLRTWKPAMEATPASPNKGGRQRSPGPYDCHVDFPPRTRAEIFKMIKALPNPPMLARQQYLPTERITLMRPRARYIVRMQHPRQQMFLCFSELPMPMVGAIIHREASDGGRPTILTGAVVTVHSGTPEAQELPQPMYVRWKLAGEMVDVRTKPWTVIRRVQLAQPVPEGCFQLVDPENLAIVDVEIILLR